MIRSGKLPAVEEGGPPDDAGYYWKDGMPYTGNAVLKENFFPLETPDGFTWMT